tara:strand:+ start:121 stop:753 length:633 start_codon:yes stop_codon:yes gene_type:complete
VRRIDDYAGRGRHYASQGLIVPSVTTVLGATKHPEDLQALNRWRARLGEEKAEEVRKKAAERGTRVHAEIERELKEPTDKIYCVRTRRALGFYKKHFESLIELEAPLFHAEALYAGTGDLFAVAKEHGPTCLDWKTTDSPRGCVRHDHLVQGAAYAVAWNAMGKQPQMEAVCVVVLGPLRIQDSRWVSGEELTALVREWAQRLARFRLGP